MSNHYASYEAKKASLIRQIKETKTKLETCTIKDYPKLRDEYVNLQYKLEVLENLSNPLNKEDKARTARMKSVNKVTKFSYSEC